MPNAGGYLRTLYWCTQHVALSTPFELAGQRCIALPAGCRAEYSVASTANEYQKLRLVLRIADYGRRCRRRGLKVPGNLTPRSGVIRIEVLKDSPAQTSRYQQQILTRRGRSTGRRGNEAASSNPSAPIAVAVCREHFPQTLLSAARANKVNPAGRVAAAGPCVVTAPPGTRPHPLHVPVKLREFSHMSASRPLTKRPNANVPEPPGRLSTKYSAARPCVPIPSPGTSFHPLHLRVGYEKALKNLQHRRDSGQISENDLRTELH